MQQAQRREQKETAMKTPHRSRAYVSQFATSQDCKNARARYKRKNRIKQLKRSLQRYKQGENMPFYSHELHAYLLLQELKHPGKKATAQDWGRYRGDLNRIRIHLVQAMANAVRAQEQAREREEGEQ